MIQNYSMLLGMGQSSSHQGSWYSKPTQWFKITDLHFGRFSCVSVTKQNKNISTQEKYAMNSFTQLKPNFSFSLFSFFPPGVINHIEDLEIPAKQGEWPSVFWVDQIPPQLWLASACPEVREAWLFLHTLHLRCICSESHTLSTWRVFSVARETISCPVKIWYF